MVSPVFVMLALCVFVECLLGIGWLWCVIWLNEEVRTSIGKELSQTDATVSTPGQVPTFLQYTLQSSYSHPKSKTSFWLVAVQPHRHIDMQIKPTKTSHPVGADQVDIFNNFPPDVVTNRSSGAS